MELTKTRNASMAMLSIGMLLRSPAMAGPTWPEGPEAGPLPGTAQKVNASGPVAFIFGSLEGPSPAPIAGRGLTGDFQDMYLIKVNDPLAFMAATDPAFNGFAEFNTQLFLFTGPDHPDGPGLGVFANDDSPMVLFGESRLGNGVTDGVQHPALLSGVHYYLAISGFGSDPVSPIGPIFNLAMPEERSGPDGIGGPFPITGWTGGGDFGGYTIALQGVTGQTYCPTSDINQDGVTDTADLGILISRFGTPAAGHADLNFDGVVDTADLGILISTFGIVCP
jgi:hypothetical protein